MKLARKIVIAFIGGYALYQFLYATGIISLALSVYKLIQRTHIDDLLPSLMKLIK